MDESQNQSELDFLRAMSAYRKAKETGDAQLIAAAEEALRAQVRSELTGGES